MSEHAVRPARARDLDHLAAVEDSGLALFAEAFGDLGGSALSAPAESGAARAAKPGFVMVAGDPPVGFAHVLDLDGHAHLEQLSVLPSRGRRGIGTELIEAVCDRLAVKGYGSLTLRTYADLAWNGPYYARHGFVEVGEDEPRTNAQLAMVEREEELGLTRHGRRILMRRPLRRHRTQQELHAFLGVLDEAGKDEGVLRAVVRRPAEGVREVLEEGELDLKVGLVGDTWIDRGSSRTSDGSSHPDMQLNVMSHRLVEFLAGDPERERLAGDQLLIDLDLSHANLPAGSLLRLGEPERGAVIAVTEQPHNGCAKFISRFGRDAMVFVNGPEGKPRRLRGLCARVVEPGRIRPGDRVVVLRPDQGSAMPASEHE